MQSVINSGMIKNRMLLNNRIREFFQSREYLEADVPLLAPSLIPEAAIEAFCTRMVDPYGGDQELFLLPSPEWGLKQLIADGCGNVFQISKAFRNSEQTGRFHNPEFTMLEYYTMGFGFLDSISLTGELFEALCSLPFVPEPVSKAFRQPFLRITVPEAFRCFGNIVLEDNLQFRELKQTALELGYSVENMETWEECFNLILVSRIEPSLPPDIPVVLYQYPRQIRTLAKGISDTPWNERWELYFNGIELGNCYTEENRREELETFFREEIREKEEKALVTVQTDQALAELYSRLPDCSGAALGVDRILMVLTGAGDIREVLSFPASRQQ